MPAYFHGPDENAERPIRQAYREIQCALEIIDANVECEAEELSALLISVAISLVAERHPPAEIHSWASALIGRVTADLATRRHSIQ